MEIIGILLFIGSAIGGGILTLIFLQIFVQLIVRSIGEDKFVDMGGLEPCSAILYSGFLGGISYTFAAHKWGYIPALLLFPTLSFLCVIYFVLWLRFATFGKNKREFQIENGQIVRLQDGVVLRPTFLIVGMDYDQTDAYHGYITYQLILRQGKEELARNCYTSEKKKNEALNEVVEAARDIPCCALDLIFVRRETETLWWRVEIGQENASMLCGSLLKLPDENRNWWRQWLRPQFSVDGFAEISQQELEQHLKMLLMTYAQLLPDDERPNTPPEEVIRQLNAIDQKKEREKFFEIYKEYSKIRRNDWLRLEMLLRRGNAPIQIMTQRRFNDEIEKVTPKGASIVYGSADKEYEPLAVRIQPR